VKPAAGGYFATVIADAQRPLGAQQGIAPAGSADAPERAALGPAEAPGEAHREHGTPSGRAHATATFTTSASTPAIWDRKESPALEARVAVEEPMLTRPRARLAAGRVASSERAPAMTAAPAVASALEAVAPVSEPESVLSPVIAATRVSSPAGPGEPSSRSRSTHRAPVVSERTGPSTAIGREGRRAQLHAQGERDGRESSAETRRAPDDHVEVERIVDRAGAAVPPRRELPGDTPRAPALASATPAGERAAGPDAGIAPAQTPTASPSSPPPELAAQSARRGTEPERSTPIAARTAAQASNTQPVAAQPTVARAQATTPRAARPSGAVSDAGPEPIAPAAAPRATPPASLRAPAFARLAPRAGRAPQPAPIVRIGQLDIVVEANAPQDQSTAHAPPSPVGSDLASRRYLRGP
jgi:hypothetical protein